MSDDAKPTVVQLPRPKANARVIEILEEALAQAKDGHLEGIVLCAHYRDSTWKARWSNVSYPAAMGYLARTSHKMNVAWDAET